MKKARIILAAVGIPLLAPAIMYGVTYLLGVSAGNGLSFPLADFYQVGLPYAYAVLLLGGTPLFALLLSKRISSVLPFVAAGAAIFPVSFGLVLGYAAIKNEELNISGTDGIFIVSAILSGAVLGAVFWVVAIAGHSEKTQSNI
jgi:hypothetical protein